MVLAISDSDVEVRIDQVIEKYKQFINPGLARLMQFGGFGEVEETAEGCTITTTSGKQYLDFLGGFGVFSLGHRHPRVVEAVHRQLDRMPLSSKTFFAEPQAALAARLAELAPGDLQYSFFSNSGAEAVEAAIKMARLATGKTDFVCAQGAYHGKTMGALAATGREKYRKPFAPMVPGFTHVPYNDLAAMEAAITERTCAILIETVQGEGGIIVGHPGYLSGLRQLCDRHNILLIADEVQTGLGRTGALFGVNHENVTPDIMTLAKALGGGVMPIAATLSTSAIWEHVFAENPLIHTSTFGGNQLACAAGLAALEVTVEERLSEQAAERGAQLVAGLRQAQEELPDVITDVRGQGLMVGVEFAEEDFAALTINQMAAEGVIAAYTLNNPKVIRMEPPLIVSSAQVDQAVAVFLGAARMAKSLLEDMA